MSSRRILPLAAILAAAVLITSVFAACGEKNDVPESTEPSVIEIPATEPPTQANVATIGDKPVVASDPQLGSIVGDDVNGYFFAGVDGMIDHGRCDGVKINGEDWVVCEGKAYKVYTEAGATWFSAAQAVAKCTDTSMTREEKLRAAFDYIKTAYLEGVLHDPPYQEMDWPVVCANDLFVYGKGDCFSYGAAYAYMAKAIGYEEVYACNSGGHGWAEIEGKFYDPEWDMHHNEYNHFGVSPEDACDVNYSGTLMDGVDWMRVLI